MPRVFINYRTGDEESSAVLVETELSRRFGSDNIFHASKSILPGERFEKSLLRAVWRSDALVALIGRNWLAARDPDGRRALDNENDWIRREIREAFEHDLRVIPLLVSSVPRLSAADLPEDIAVLASCQYLRLDLREATSCIDRLASKLSELVPGLIDVAANPESIEAGKAVHNQGQRGGIGNISGGTITAITDARGPLNTGSGHQTFFNERPAEDNS